jgi:hypothetical protein
VLLIGNLKAVSANGRNRQQAYTKRLVYFIKHGTDIYYAINCNFKFTIIYPAVYGSGYVLK